MTQLSILLLVSYLFPRLYVEMLLDHNFSNLFFTICMGFGIWNCQVQLFNNTIFHFSHSKTHPNFPIPYNSFNTSSEININNHGRKKSNFLGNLKSQQLLRLLQEDLGVLFKLRELFPSSQ